MIREINKLLEKVLLDGNKKCVLVELNDLFNSAMEIERKLCYNLM
ncbi:hypothetical protein [Clostridioides difficile]|nr:hypothetical protein [Clostridioides difficile]MCW0823092.1 hypothetical protein [Clostridioides difficile]MDC9246524.1 hypothetical protein [Clostridioides difficile]MDC9634039.1 hypothetical protein [Clostridioides difficile]MDK3208392.1 hypothetical protein [Clostridioides difficile]MDL0187727.1 hypothetical protein [Clostridioides difficile]